MRIIGFKYLQRRWILTLALVLTLSSTLFSITALSLLGFYSSFTAYLGEGEDIVAIYHRGSSTPFTGLVPEYLAEQVSAINGVLASSPEVIAPCVVKGGSVFLRGIIPEAFSKLNQLAMVEGDMLELSDMDSMTVGMGLAERLNLKLGEKVLLLGVLSSQYLELKIKGIYEAHLAMGDEALAPLYVGQWLRGTDYNHVTLIRVKTDGSEVTRTKILEEFAKEASSSSLGDDGESGGVQRLSEGIVPGVRIGFRAEDIGVEEAQRFMKIYMDRYGVTKDALLILAIMVFFFASASITSAAKTLLHQHRREIEVLKSIGASNRTIKIDLSAKVLAYSLASSALGIILASATLVFVEGNSYLQILSHRVVFQLDPVILALNFVLASLISILTIIRWNLE